MDTEILLKSIEQTQDMKQYEELMLQNQSIYPQWGKYLQTCMNEREKSVAQLAEDCQVSKKTAQSWLSRVPTKRKFVIAIALSLGMNLKQTNQLLVRYGKYPKLYPKNPEDAIYIYLINSPRHEEEKSPYCRFADLEEAYRRMEADYTGRQAGADCDTAIVLPKLLQVRNQPELEAFLRDHMEVFCAQYQKLVNYIEPWLSEHSLHGSLHSQRAGAKIEQHISNIRKQLIVPKRNFLIALGLYLSMPEPNISEMLELAGMERLCPKDKLEGALIVVLQNLFVELPGLFGDGSTEANRAIAKFEPRFEELRCDRKRFDQFVAESDSPVAAYVRQRIEESGLREELYASELYALL